MITLTQLQYLVAVEKHRHFGQAARACLVSQPSLSMQIQKVEDLLGFPVFDRNRKPVLPTQRGRRVIEQARRVLFEEQKLLDIAREDVGVVSGEFRLGVIPTLAPYLLPVFVESFSTQFSKVNLKIDELKTETILEQLERDELDGGLVVTPLDVPSLKELEIFDESLFVYASKNHDLLKKESVRAGDLSREDLWLLADGHCFRSQVLALCSSKSTGVFSNVQFQGGDLETLRNLIRKSAGYTIVPELFVDSLPSEERKAHVRPILHPTPVRRVSLVSRRSLWKSEILEALESTIKDELPKKYVLERPGRERLIKLNLG
jgi:LysR family hydrogen peroxide-inducible transcriptional activator